jgi:hypothetical protein
MLDWVENYSQKGKKKKQILKSEPVH